MRAIDVIITTCLLFLSAVHTVSGQDQAFVLDGAMTLGNSEGSVAAGTIRWNSNTSDFEGFNGDNWVSLTQSASSFGIAQPYRYESQILFESEVNENENYGEDVAIEGSVYAVGTPETNSGQGAVYLYNDGILKDKIVSNGSQEFGERVDISGDWMVIGADDGEAYVYDLESSRLAALKKNTPVDYSEFIKVDGDLLGVKGEDSTIYTFVQNGGDWDEIGQITSKEIAALNFDISHSGHIAATELGQSHVRIFRLNGNEWSETQIINPPNGFRSGSIALYDNQLVINYVWNPPSGPTSNVVPEQGFLRVFQYVNGNWLEQDDVFVPNTVGLGIVEIWDDIIITVSDIFGSSTGQTLHNGQGKVHVIQRAGDNWNYQYSLTSSDGRAGDIFGQDIDIGTDGIIVGAIWADGYVGTQYESNRQGKAYIFKK
ncbi:MAG: FG-GAP repeat protein [Bacteroidota bacterium]